MRKLNIAIALALGLAVPFAAMGATVDDEVTIRVMNMYENTNSAITQNIELPDSASEQAAQNAFQRIQNQVRDRNMDGTGQGPGSGSAPGDGREGDGYGPGPAAGGGDSAGFGHGHEQGAGNGAEAGDLQHVRSRDQDREHVRDMDQDRTMELDREQIRDTEHVSENEPPAYQEPQQEPPMIQEMEQQQNQIDHEPVELPGQDRESQQNQHGQGSGG